MAIGPIELHGAISRTQDFQTIKFHEDNKGMTDQVNLMHKMEKDSSHNMKQVRDADNVEKKGDNTDAKEKGNAEYTGDGGKRRPHRQENKEDGRVVVKQKSGFDVSI